MAHFAELDRDNYVKRVIVISSKNFSDADGVEDESLGIAYCKSLYGSDTKWRQTSFNGKIRGRFAAIGCKYNEDLDIFHIDSPHNSWTLNPTTTAWEAPIPCPEIPDGQEGDYEWDEEAYVNDTSSPKTAGWVFVETTPTEPAE